MEALTQLEPEVSEWTFRRAMFTLHGALLIMAFILLYPAGIIAIQSGMSKSFKYHWTIQLAASLLGTAGIITGLVLSPDIRTARHKQLGVLLGLLLGFQLFSDWRHHIIFTKIHRRTWISRVHIWVGRFIISLGWCNLMLGLSLGGYADGYIYLTAGVVCMEAISLVVMHFRYQRTVGKTKLAQIATRAREASDNQFELGEDSSDDDDKLEEPYPLS
ncbi:hypothetical protein OIDMADRAFT_60867 [Oidiodendron maius Zn]|uniref:Cytochrome b561 domain-containing protein n=1 Tax=Oidiodendron maius (strain Zn) TaxID=913774 RepID=A0A0C3CWF0_OIDMZ|nr:hypothetical protein OIDMADRAFT_60867 [Oidiodendron maius Zn]